MYDPDMPGSDTPGEDRPGLEQPKDERPGPHFFRQHPYRSNICIYPNCLSPRWDHPQTMDEIRKPGVEDAEVHTDETPVHRLFKRFRR